MRKINLKTNDFKIKSSGGGATSLLIGITLLLVTGAAFGWLYWEKETMAKETKAIEDQISQKQTELDKTNFKEVYNFQGRVMDLGLQMQAYANPVGSLMKVAAATFPETYFSSLNVGSSAVSDSYEGQLMVPDFPALARQINAYKNIKGADNFVLSSSGYTEDGVQATISFDLREADDTPESENAE